MIDFTDDVASMLDDLGAPCAWTDASGRTVRGSAIVDMPGAQLLDGTVLGTDYAATIDAAVFAGISSGDVLSIPAMLGRGLSDRWRVREPLLLDDGALMRCTLTPV